MKKNFFCLTLLAGLTIVSSAGILERDNFVYAASSAEGTQKAMLLIRAAEESPDDAIAPLAMLSKIRLPRKEAEKIIRKYDELWSKHPDNLEIIHTGIALHKNFNGINEDVLALLKKSRKNYSSGNPQTNPANILVLRLALHSITGDNKDGEKFAETLDHNAFCVELSPFYHVAAYRAKVAGRTLEAQQLYQKYMQTVRLVLSKIPPKAKIEDLSRWMQKLFKNKEFEYAGLLFEEIKKRTADPVMLDNIRSLYCLHTNDYSDAKKEASQIKNKSIDKNMLCFQAAINAKNWAEAKKLLNSFPDNIRKVESALLAVAMGDCKTIAAVADDPKSNLTAKDRVFYKIQVAHMIKDKKLYFEAKKQLGNTPLSADELNSLGYTAAELGVDLKESESMLRRAVKTAPYSAAFLDSLAYICYLKHHYAEAEKLINRALDCITPDVEPSVILEHAGDIALAQGNFLKAKEMYQRALEFGKDDILFDSKKVKNKLDGLK